MLTKATLWFFLGTHHYDRYHFGFEEVSLFQSHCLVAIRHQRFPLHRSSKRSNTISSKCTCSLDCTFTVNYLEMFTFSFYSFLSIFSSSFNAVFPTVFLFNGHIFIWFFVFLELFELRVRKRFGQYVQRIDLVKQKKLFKSGLMPQNHHSLDYVVETPKVLLQIQL